MLNTSEFTKYMSNTYEAEELQEIATHGCASACPAGMIYYTETLALFDEYKHDLFEIIENWKDVTGEAPNITMTDGFVQFANAVVWFCAEVVASELSETEEE